MKKQVLYGVILILSFFLDSSVAKVMALIRNPFFDIIMQWFSSLLTMFFVLVIISSLFLYQERKTKYISILLVSIFSGFVVSNLLKLVIARSRPEGLIFTSIGFASLFILNIPNYSFPSFHATLAFSVLPVLDLEFRKIKPFWIIFSIMIVISRIYLNKHYLSDVVAGCLLGYLIGYFALRAEKYVKQI